MTSYLIGNLIGRFLMSMFLVWIALLCINRCKVGLSTKKLIRPLPLLTTILLFFLGLMGHAAAASTPNQKYRATNFPGVSVEQAVISSEPSWVLEAKS